MTHLELKKRDIKIIKSGDVIEVYDYMIPIAVEHANHGVKGLSEVQEKLDKNLYRARAEIRRCIWTNITPYSKFLTLTYAKTNLDYEKLVYDFKQFIKNLGRKGFKNIPWLYVTEHQKERGIKEGNAGSLHIHAVLFTDEYIPYEVINACWKQGATDIAKIESINNLGAYVCKYLTKDEFELFEKNSYHISRNLKKPEIIAHDGYISDPDFAKDILDNLDVTYMGCKNIYYNGSAEPNNSIIYKQGRLKK